MALQAWDSLSHELDLWQHSSRVAEWWWRDDDAARAGPKLERLFTTTRASGLLLATVPAWVEDSLAPLVAATDHVQIGQHGYAHINHAPRGQGLGAWELGLHRDSSVVLKELDEGRQRLQRLFGQRFSPVIIPPWNHIDTRLFDSLVARGYSGISLFGARSQPELGPGCSVVNTHCDPIKWKQGPRFTGVEKAVAQCVAHLEAKRTGQLDRDEPTGILTHHIDLDEAGWQFCEELEAMISAHPATRWRPINSLFTSVT